ncbi:hypothetical protein A5N86_09915 [Geobacillus thermoleovorans]|nr:hypothetical protein A5N86_09915 [Geobacillus thermoleovorans]
MTSQQRNMAALPIREAALWTFLIIRKFYILIPLLEINGLFIWLFPAWLAAAERNRMVCGKTECGFNIQRCQPDPFGCINHCTMEERRGKT